MINIKIKLMVYILFLSMLLSCFGDAGNKIGHWESIQAEGLKRKDESFNKILFLDEQTGLMLGLRYTDDFYKKNEFWNTRALIYRTEDGGVSWKEYDFGTGEFKYACFANKDTLYAIKTTMNMDNSIIDSTYVYTSIDNGESWKITSTLKGNFEELFIFDNQLLLFGQFMDLPDRPQACLVAKKDDLKWSRIELPELDGKIIQLKGNRLGYYLSSNVQTIPFKYSELDIETNELKTENLPIGFRVETMVQGSDGKFWFGGSEGDNGVLYVREGENKYQKVKEFSGAKYTASKVFVHDKTITVFVMELKSLWTEFKVFRSENNGKSWVEEQLPITTPLSCIGAYGANNFWIFSQAGRLQIRK